ncbi:MAG: Ig-like domain-containing protein [Bacteroidales bacterium]|nr:Ig-like domain-containing protein [Bacteroidales bacterium]
MKRYITIIFAFAALLSSCTVTDLRDNAPVPDKGELIDGSWALVEEDNLTSTVYSFLQGKIFMYESADKYYYKDASIWNCPPDAFALIDCGRFQIKDGCLYAGAGNLNLGEISVNGDTLILNSIRYLKLSGFSVPIPHDDQNHVTSVRLEKHDVFMNKGESLSLDVDFGPKMAVDRRLVWRSSAPSVVDVDENGLIVAKSACDTAVNVIVSSFFLEKSDTCRVSVINILSSDGTANSYIVNSGGRCCFDASVKGNSSEKTGVGTFADVIWETLCTSKSPVRYSLVKDCEYDWRSGMLSFTAASSVSGNALVALFDKNGAILWTWHIWVVPDYDPATAAQEYYNNSGTVMDRNLGALSADPVAGDLTHGLLYQWGRKDPFVPGDMGTAFDMDFQWLFAEVTKDTGNIPFSIAYPTTFLSAASGSDWLYYEDGEASDFSRWKPSEKTKYDPCPPGWRIPDYEIWRNAASGQTAPKVKENGIDFKGYFSDAAVWYPKAGWMEGGQPAAASGGRYWGAADSCIEPFLRQQMSIDAQNNCGIENCKPFYGCSVRCVKE